MDSTSATEQNKSELLRVSERILAEKPAIDTVLKDNRLSKRSIDLLIKSCRNYQQTTLPTIIVESPPPPPLSAEQSSNSFQTEDIDEIAVKLDAFEKSVYCMDRSTNHLPKLRNSRVGGGGLDRDISISNVSLNQTATTCPIEETKQILDYFRKSSDSESCAAPLLSVDESKNMIKDANTEFSHVQTFFDKLRQTVVDGGPQPRNVAPVSLDADLSQLLQQVHKVFT